jgi:pimeloyl-ACP methyl ester carboxylesterase
LQFFTKPRSLTGRHACWSIGILLVLAALAYGGVSVFTADRLTRATNRPLTIDPHGLSADAQPWSVRTDDGIVLRGWYLPTAKTRQLIVLVHGMWSSWLEMSALGRDLHEHGFDVLLFDLRGHGQSDPSRLYLGRRERRDIRAVMTWGQEQGFSNDRIGWLGYSMGGSTILMEAARNPLIHAAVIDSPYGNLPELLNKELGRHSGLPGWFNPGILLAARVIYGVRTDDLIPIRSAGEWGNRPLLLIHGESDTLVPVSQAREIATAVGASCLTMTLPGVDHVQAYQSDPKAYIRVVGSVLSGSSQPVNGRPAQRRFARAPGPVANDERPGSDESRLAGRVATNVFEFKPGLVRSGPKAAMRPVGRHVRRLIEEPEPLPLIAGLSQVF